MRLKAIGKATCIMIVTAAVLGGASVIAGELIARLVVEIDYKLQKRKAIKELEITAQGG